MPPDLLGRYEITGELGRGAMGVVYKARDPLIDRTVAIKTVGLDLSADEAAAFEQRFFREAKSAGRLNHPNIVTIHDVGRSNGSAYIAMEFLQGRSLREILDSGVVLPPERIADIVAQVADGLAFAHENGVVHRDIKPANIMVLDNGGVKITDFGIALLPTGARTVVGTVFGSPKYMSPERIAGAQGGRPFRHFFAGHGALRDAYRIHAVLRRRSQDRAGPGDQRDARARRAVATRASRPHSTTSSPRQWPKFRMSATPTRRRWPRTCGISAVCRRALRHRRALRRRALRHRRALAAAERCACRRAPLPRSRRRARRSVAR